MTIRFNRMILNNRLHKTYKREINDDEENRFFQNVLQSQ